MGTWTLGELDSLALDPGELTLNDGRTIERAFRDEAAKLAGLLERAMATFYESYRPVQYMRTGRLYRSLPEGKVKVEVDGMTLRATLKYNDNVNHPSLYRARAANVLPLMEQGYSVKADVPFREVPYFGWRTGVGSIAAAIAEFNSTNALGIQAVVEFDDY